MVFFFKKPKINFSKITNNKCIYQHAGFLSLWPACLPANCAQWLLSHMIYDTFSLSTSLSITVGTISGHQFAAYVTFPHCGSNSCCWFDEPEIHWNQHGKELVLTFHPSKNYTFNLHREPRAVFFFQAATRYSWWPTVRKSQGSFVKCVTVDKRYYCGGNQKAK